MLLNVFLILVIYVSCLSCFLICSKQPCDHLGKGWPLVLSVFVTFPCDVLGQEWYFIAAIPDLCLLTYFQYPYKKVHVHVCEPGSVVQSVTCLATDVSLTADPGVASSITARSNTFVEIDHEIISTVILLPSAESFKKGCCQLQGSVTRESMCTKYWLTARSSLPRKKCIHVVR